MNDLCADIGYKSIIRFGEQLCGDHIDIVKPNDESTVIVLSDGLGSGVKASVLSTLTSKIISTMLAEGLSLEACVETIAETLPVCSVRGLAYSTFSIIHLKNNRFADLIQYDNPHAIIIRDGEIWDYPKTEINIGGKKIYKSIIKLQENDVFIIMSDGCPYADCDGTYNSKWSLEDIAEYMLSISFGGFTAKTMSTMLVDECNKYYAFEPGDDATACVVRIIKREPMNLLFGPPFNRDDDERMMSLFFAKEGKHIICGGTTARIASKYLRKPVNSGDKFSDDGIPPISEIDGVDLVTEGIITLNKVLEYAKDYLGENKYYEHWSFNKDGASLISRMLFEEATDINFYVGRAVNPAHQNPSLSIDISIKMNLVEELSKCLEKMGKRIKVSYF